MLFQAILLVHYWKSHLVFCFGNITHIVRLEDNKSSRSICVCVSTNKHQRCINMTTSPLNFGALKALQSVGTSSLFVWVYYKKNHHQYSLRKNCDESTQLLRILLFPVSSVPLNDFKYFSSTQHTADVCLGKQMRGGSTIINSH